MTKRTTDRPSTSPPGAPPRRLMAVIVALQVLGALFFSYDIFGPAIGLRTAPLSWRVHELIEIAAAAGLALGSVFGFVMLRRSDTRRRRAEGKLAALSLGFHTLLEERFADWGLTPAERDVAFFVMKGFSTQEIAALRKTSEGTVKAQTNAIYRKADVNGRAQLVSLFIEDLMHGELAETALSPPIPATRERKALPAARSPEPAGGSRQA